MTERGPLPNGTGGDLPDPDFSATEQHKVVFPPQDVEAAPAPLPRAPLSRAPLPRAPLTDAVPTRAPVSGRAPSSRRPPESGLRPILLIDALALLLVIATAPAAWLWIDSSSPGPRPPTAAATSVARAEATPSLHSASPGASTAVVVPSGGSVKPVVGDGTWARAASMPRGLWGSGSAVLRDGRVMVVGGAAGSSSNDATAAVSIFDPAGGSWTAATPMLQPRAYPMVVRLADGSVLVAGGSLNGQPLDTAERYNPSNGTWVAAGRLNLPRTQGNLILLQDGRALATGGGIEGSPGWTSTASIELFDPAKGVWTIGAPMSVPRARHTATLLATGDVLVTGGGTTFHGDAGKVTSNVEIYTPRTNSWRVAAPMSIPRYTHEAALMADGRVLVAGGWSAMTSDDVSKASTEIFDPAANRWSAGPPLGTARAEFVMVRLPGGRLLAVAGVDRSGRLLDSAELLGTAADAWAPTGKLAEARMWPAVALLPDGRVLLAGGGTDVNANHRSVMCEVYAAP